MNWSQLRGGELELEVGVRDGTAHVIAAGDLDLANAAELVRAVGEAIDARADIVLDVRHVAFIDVTGLDALRRCRALAAAAGTGFRLITGAKSAAARIILLTRIGRALDALPAVA